MVYINSIKWELYINHWSRHINRYIRFLGEVLNLRFVFEQGTFLTLQFDITVVRGMFVNAWNVHSPKSH